MTAHRFRVTGRVQGVGYRWFVRQIAGGLGLRGYARNLPDGSVEVVAAGPAEAIERLAEALASGPSGARVARVERDAGPEEATIPLGFTTR